MTSSQPNLVPSPQQTRNRLALLFVCSSSCVGLLVARSISFAGVDPQLRPALRALRLAVGIASGYLLTVIVLGLVVRAWDHVRAARSPHRTTDSLLHRLADRITLGLVRSMLNSAVGSGLVVALLAGTAGAATATTSRRAATTATSFSASGAPDIATRGRNVDPVRGVRRNATIGHRLVRAGDPSSGQEWPALPDRPPRTTGTPPPTTPATPTTPTTPTTIRTTATPTSPRRLATDTTLPSHPPAPALLDRVSPGAITNRRTSPGLDSERHGAGRSNPLPPVAFQPVTAGPAMPPAAATREHRVRPGESFWSIAERVVHELDPHAKEPEVARYWRQLIQQNRDRLPVPGEPDLLFSGTVIDTPPAR